MTTVPAVEARHRLHPADLAGKPRTLTIARITIQGVEEARPLAYFQGVNLPLALTPAHCNDLARITGSAVLRDWHGVTVVLDPVESDDGMACVIRAPGEPVAPRRRQAPTLRFSTRVRRLLLALLFGLLLGLVARAEQTRAMVEWFLALQAGS